MNPIEGVDYSAHVRGTPSAAALKGRWQKQFVCTYVTNYGGDDQDWRANDKAELAALIEGGIDIVANWEGAADGMKDGYQAGVNAAQNAQYNLTRLGLPSNQPIYFSADWDATPQDQVAIDAYLTGCASVLGASRVGVYGGYWIVKRCFENKTAHWFWQTTAWSGGNIYPAIHLYQYAYGIIIEGVDTDLTQAWQLHYGQQSDYLTPPVVTTPPPPQIVYVKAQDISGEIKNGAYQGTQLYPFQHTLKAAKGGCHFYQHGVADSHAQTQAVAAPGTAIELSYTFFSQQEKDWWGLTTNWDRVRLAELVG